MEGGPGRNEDREMCGESIRRKEARRLNGKMNDWRLPCPLSFPFFPVLISFCNQKIYKEFKEREKETEETEDPVKSMRERIHAVRDAQ